MHASATAWRGAAISGPTVSLAQQEIDNTFQILLLIGILVAVILVIVVVALFVRRRLLESSDNEIPSITIEQMRRMHEAGELSDEEWEAVRARLIARMHGQMTNNESGHEASASDDDSVLETLDSADTPEHTDKTDPPDQTDQRDAQDPENDSDEPPDEPPDNRPGQHPPPGQ